MFNKLRTHFGVPGAIAVAALVFAMVGGAWAANKYVITSTGQIKPSVLKKLKGAAGPAGKDGSNGSNGSTGATGPAGAPGSKGADGISVTTSPASPGECGTPGGVKFTSASGNAKICNGQTGFTKTLPSGATETGAWAYGPTAGAEENIRVPISFPIPVQLPGSEVGIPTFYIENGGTPTPEAEAACPGTHESPAAEPGNLCVYERGSSGSTWFRVESPELGTNFAGPVGAVLNFKNSGAEGFALGDWAVTAP